MGVTISHRLGIRKGRIKNALDRTQAIAEQMKTEQANKLGIDIEIVRYNDYELRIDIGNCETLAFYFKTFEEDEAEYNAKGWREGSYLKEYFAKKVLATADSAHLKNWPDQRILWSHGFCKTQFIKSIAEHMYVAELIRSLAQVADFASVDDEGDYYHTLKLEDAANAIESNGALIAQIGGILSGMGWQTQSTPTTIKGRKRKQK